MDLTDHHLRSESRQALLILDREATPGELPQGALLLNDPVLSLGSAEGREHSVGDALQRQEDDQGDGNRSDHAQGGSPATRQLLQPQQGHMSHHSRKASTTDTAAARRAGSQAPSKPIRRVAPAPKATTPGLRAS